jgi:hypothetical protein
MGRMIRTASPGARRRPATTVAAALGAVLLTVAGCNAESPQSRGPSAASPAGTTVSPVPPAVPSAQPSTGPTFTDVTQGDTASVVKLLAFDPNARSAVVEPTAMMTGDQYCAMFAVPAADDRCGRAWIAEDSRTKATLPVRQAVKLSTVRGGDPKCIDRDTGAGTCAATPRQFVDWYRQNPQALVRVTTVSGTVVAIAEVYLP